MSDKKSEVIFNIENDTYIGKIEYGYNNWIKLTFLTNNLIINKPEKELEIEIIYGAIKNESGTFLLYNSTMYLNHFSTNNLYEYTILSAYGIFGSIDNEFDLKYINSFGFQFDKLHEWIGMKNISMEINEKQNKYALKVDMEDENEIKISENKYIKMRHYNTVPLGIQNNGEYTVKQNSSFEYKINSEINIKTIKKHFNILRQIIMFCCDKPINIKNAYVNYKNRDNVKQFKIYFRSENYDDTKILNPLVTYNKFFQNVEVIYSRWEEMNEKVKYISYFYSSYYSTKFIDQKLTGLITI